MSTPVNIIVDGVSVVDSLQTCVVDQAKGGFCRSVTLSMSGLEFFALCNPATGRGTLRIKVVMVTTTYEFLLEERDADTPEDGISFTVWGRSKQALLDTPYSETITDTDDTNHVWQLQNNTVSVVVAAILDEYCPSGMMVNWNVEDFVIYQMALSISNESPLSVIASLASAAGAELVPEIDGSLSVELYSVAPAAAVETYNDLDDIVQLNESVSYSSGFNAVTVYGYAGPSGIDKATSLSVESQSEGAIYTGRPDTVRVYYYHYAGLQPTCSFIDGRYTRVRSGTERISEKVAVVFGYGNTSKTDVNGKTEVTGNEGTPLEFRTVQYSARYVDIALYAAYPGEYQALFYFTDKSATSLYSFTVDSRGTSPDPDDPPYGSSDCTDDSISVEKDRPDTVVPGDTVYIRVFSKTKPSRARANNGNVSFVKKTSKGMTESLVFENGAAETSRPVASGYKPGGGVFSGPSLESSGDPGASTTNFMQYKGGSTQLKNARWANDADAFMPATITYDTEFYLYKVVVPSNWTEPTFYVWFTIPNCGVHELGISVDVDAVGVTDITLHVTDYATDIALAGVTVYVDGAAKGRTDGDGNLYINNIRKGDHSLQLSKTGYLNSSVDDLSNDSFTVS